MSTPDIFTLPVRVYYRDTDAGGVVYHGVFLDFMERTRTEWLRSLGYELNALAVDQDMLFVVRAAQLDYLKPARLNDLLLVTAQVIELGRSRIVLRQQVMLKNNGETDVLVEGKITLVTIGAAQFRVKPIPDVLRESLTLAMTPQDNGQPVNV